MGYELLLSPGVCPKTVNLAQFSTAELGSGVHQRRDRAVCRAKAPREFTAWACACQG